MEKFKYNNYRSILISIVLTGFLLSCSEDDPERSGLEAPLFQEIPDAWVNPYFEIDMDNIWSSQGIDRSGKNYFFLSKPDEFSCSSRFIPTSKYFQSWVGIYTIEDNDIGTYAINDGEIDAEAIVALAIADQKAWLISFGLNIPNVEIDESIPVSAEETTIDNVRGWQVKGRLISNVDVGINNPTTGFFLTEIMDNFWDDEVNSYQEVSLDVTAYVWHTPQNNELNVAYYNLVRFQNLEGESISNEQIQPELEEMVLSATVFEP